MDLAKRGGKPDRITNISPDGDVVFMVGEEKIRLKVQSHCLRSASKTFGVMFGSVWREGQSLSKESPTEVPLVEDDADAMWTICCIIHHRNDLVPPRMTAEEILQIAILVDKYDLKVALKFASVEWLKPRVNATRADMGFLLAANFLFDNPDVFIAHIMALILHYNGSYMDFLDDEFTGQIIPPRTFYLLEERRTKFRAELLQLLMRGKGASCNCGWGKGRSERYGLLLADYGPIQMLEVPVAEIITKMEQASTDDMERKYCKEMSSYASYGSYYHEPLQYHETFLGRLDIMKKKASICIDCVRSLGRGDSVRSAHE